MGNQFERFLSVARFHNVVTEIPDCFAQRFTARQQRDASISPPAVSAIPEGAQSSSEKVLANFAYGSDAEESEEGAPSARR